MVPLFILFFACNSLFSMEKSTHKDLKELEDFHTFCQALRLLPKDIQHEINVFYAGIEYHLHHLPPNEKLMWASQDNHAYLLSTDTAPVVIPSPPHTIRHTKDRISAFEFKDPYHKYQIVEKKKKEKRKSSLVGRAIDACKKIISSESSKSSLPFNYCELALKSPHFGKHLVTEKYKRNPLGLFSLMIPETLNVYDASVPQKTVFQYSLSPQQGRVFGEVTYGPPNLLVLHTMDRSDKSPLNGIAEDRRTAFTYENTQLSMYNLAEKSESANIVEQIQEKANVDSTNDRREIINAQWIPGSSKILIATLPRAEIKKRIFHLDFYQNEIPVSKKRILYDYFFYDFEIKKSIALGKHLPQKKITFQNLPDAIGTLLLVRDILTWHSEKDDVKRAQALGIIADMKNHPRKYLLIAAIKKIAPSQSGVFKQMLKLLPKK